MKPLIGIPLRCEEDEEKRSILYLSEQVRTSIIKSGGIPFAITPVQNVKYYHTSGKDMKELTEEEKDQIEKYIDVIDGMFLPGGSKFCEIDRYMLKRVIDRNIPVLGVCLGMQLMANHEQPEIKIIANEQENHKQPKEEDQYCHKVKIDKNSRLYSIIGKEELSVNSFHKRHIEDKNDMYKTVALSEDGLIEGIEYPSKNFNIGVQWHPEMMVDYDEDARKIMNAFIEAAKQKKQQKLEEKQKELAI